MKPLCSGVNIYDLSVIPALWFYIVLLVLGLTVGKALLIAVLTRLFGEDYGTSLRTGVALAQGGEFGFALLSLALSNALLSDAEAQAVLAAIVISMALAPILLRYNDRLSRLLFRDSYLKNRYKAAHQFSLDVKEVENHVIICGFRRVGQSLARFLEEQGIPYLALDLDPTIVKEARDAGSDVHYADSSRPEILVAAGIYRARILVVTLADLDAARLTVEVARRKQASIPILVRTRNELHIRELEALGATEVLPELLESGIMVAERVMKRLELPLEEINGAIERTRKDGYSALISYFRGESPKPGVLPNRQSQLHTIVLKPNDRAVGMSIAELGLGSLKLTVKSLRRGDIRGDHPSADMVLQAEDVLVLEGLSENLQQAQKRLFGERKTPHRDKPQPVKA